MDMQGQKGTSLWTSFVSLSRHRFTKRSLIALSAAAALATAGAYALFITHPDTVRLSPVAVTVNSSASLPAEVKALEAQSAALLFDRDTTQPYVAYADQSVDAQFEKATDINAIKIYGPAPFELTVRALQGASWNAIPGLSQLDLTALPVKWNTFTATQAVNTKAIRFELTMKSGASATGLKEIEIWGKGEHALVNDTALVTEMSGEASAPKPAQARLYAATPASAVVGKDSKSFTFTLDRPATNFKRAWLAYEAYGITHWVTPARRINGQSVQGGQFVFTGNEWSPLVEPIHPAWLKQGSNTLEFTLPADTTGTYSLRNVRVVAELDDGSNAIESVTTGANGKAYSTVNLNDGNLGTGWSPYYDPNSKLGKPELTVSFDKPTQLDTLWLNLANTLGGTLSVQLQVGGDWQSAGLPSINGRKLSAGWNKLSGFAGVPAEALRITFENGDGSAGEIREVLATGSGVGTAQPVKIAVAYPDAGQFYGRKAYLRGYLTTPDNGSGPATLSVGNQKSANLDGSFGLLVSKDEVGYSNQADAEPWQVTLEARYPDGKSLTQVVKLYKAFDASKAKGLLPNTVNPGFAALVTGGDAALDIDPDALDKPVNIKITPLKEHELPPLDPGMTNVTPGPWRGYRFTPHGTHFKKHVKVTLPYDETLIPKGLNEQDVKTYYFDTELNRWVVLDRYRVDNGKRKVTSLTNHFTDMINATLVVPDHPETTSYNATQMKDIKAADPGAGINLIEPPQANNMGDARLSYPIEIPPGRLGMQPQLAISYNSGGGNGWLGLGWDLSVPSITIDTRWGVPRYDNGKIDPNRGPLETETYLLNGEMLTPVAHRGPLQERNRTGDKQFYARVEGAFQRIIRKGNSPKDYWWEVTDKNGVKYIYGGENNAKHEDSTLGSGNGVFRWALRKTVDTHGNTVTYNYVTVCDTGTGDGNNTNGGATCSGGVSGYQLYIDSINYTGNSTTAGAYTVKFIRNGTVAGLTRRPDVQIDGRGGFKQVTAALLGEIDVNYNDGKTDNLVRSYKLNYQTGAFNKTLVTSVVQYGQDGTTEFNRHAFAYYDEVWNGKPTYEGFGSGHTWDTGSDLSKQLLGVNVGPSALSGAEGLSTGGSVSVGFGLTNSKVAISGNANTGFNQGTSHGTVALVDINGDGLPDKVFVDGSGVWYRPNPGKPGADTGEVTFEEKPKLVDGIRNISENESSSFNFGGQGYIVGFNAIGNMNYSYDTQRTYFSDVNGDGLVDLVNNGQVYFNRINPSTLRPDFQATSAGSPNPIGGGVLSTKGLLPVAQFEQIEQAVLAQNPLADAVRRWVAPYDGTISITGTLQLVQDQSDDRHKYKTADGVRVAIEKQGESKPRWSRRIQADDYAAYDPQTDGGSVGSIGVKRGEVIYFRVASIFDGAYDQVNWAPVITYIDKPANTTDVNGLNPYRFDASQEFIYGGRVSPVNLPFRGTIQLQGILNKLAPTTDDVSLAVYYVTKAESATVLAARRDYSMLHLKKAPLYRSTLAHDATGQIDLSAVPPITVANVDDELVVIVETDSNIDLSKVTWQAGIKPQLYYTIAFGSDKAPTDTDGKPVPGVDFTPNAQLAVKDDKNNWSITKSLGAEFNFYPDNTLPRAQESWTAPEMGWAVISPSIQLKPLPGFFANEVRTFPHNTEVVLTAKLRGQLLAKHVMRLAAGTQFNPAEHSFAIPVPKGEQIYFDLSTRDPELNGYLSETAVHSHYVRPVTTAVVNAIPVNQTGKYASWTPSATGTVTVFPSLAAIKNAKAASGNIVLHVTQTVTSTDGESIEQTLVDRVIPFDTQKPFSPQDSAFDIPLSSVGNLHFAYTTGNSTLASQLATTAVNLSVTQAYTHQDSQYNNVPLIVNNTSGDQNTNNQTTAQLPVTHDGFAAVAPTISLNGSNVFGFDVQTNLVVTRQYTTYDAEGNPVIATQQLANYPISIKAGTPYNPGANTFDVPVASGDTLLFKFTTNDSTLPSQNLELGTWVQLRQQQGANVPLTALPSMFHRYGYWQFFANAYRGWSYGGYNGEGDFANAMIDPSRFTVSNSQSDYNEGGTDHSMSEMTAFIAAPQPENERWIAGDQEWQITAQGLTSSRMMVNYVKLPRPEELATTTGGAGATAVPRMSVVEGESSMGGGFIINITSTTTPGKGLLDFMDLNGDRFPDVIGSGNIQYTQMTGGLGGDPGNTGDDYVRKTQADAYSISPAGSTAKSLADAKAYFNPQNGGAPDKPQSNEGGFGFTGSFGHTDTSVHYDLVDINGDGLPDRVRESSGMVYVRLNLGYTFDDEEQWGGASLDNGYQESMSIGGSYNDGAKGNSGGVSLTNTQGRVNTKLADINGDGLPDRVTNADDTLKVGFNQGGSFADDVTWSDTSSTKVNAGTNQSFSLGGGGSFNIPIGPLCIATCYVHVNPGVSLGTNTSRAESALQDVNGDGFPDFVASTRDDKMTVVLNRTGKTNLLKQVNRPLGASFEMEYERTGNTYEMPQSRYVMSKVTVNDGHPGRDGQPEDGPDTLETQYRYEDGYYDRYERDFYGFRKVIEEQLDTAYSSVYRTVARTYHNDTYYTKGLLASEKMEADHKPYTETVNSYEPRIEEAPEIASVDLTNARLFPQLVSTEKKFYEGGAGEKRTEQRFEYDHYGNVTYFTDSGDESDDDTVEARITYTAGRPDCQGSYITGKPLTIRVYSGSTEWRYREGEVDCTTGNLTALRQSIGNGEVAETRLSYKDNGNLESVTGPANLNNEHYTLTYDYDTQVVTHVVKVRDSFEYVSTADYDLKYGKPKTTTDLNGNVISYDYDQFGRTTAIQGPYEQGGKRDTLHFTYDFDAPVPYALTEHLNLDAAGDKKDPITTVLFTDGLKRVLQTKKSAAINGAAKMIVSGRVVFDGLGRTVEQYYPVEEETGHATAFNTDATVAYHTTTKFDVLDRTVQTTLPDGTVTAMEYSFGNDPDEKARFRTVVTDALLNTKESYRDIGDSITAVKEFNNNKAQTLWTSYAYDPLNQITQVKDVKGVLTTVEYDQLGRRTAIDNPDTGRTVTVYDNASNVKAKITANLAKAGKAITYDYEYNRLKTISYPDNAANDVSYEYGDASLQNEWNQIGRLIKVSDASGSQELFYGKLGETVKEVRTIASRTQGNSKNSPEVYTTGYRYDSFARLLELSLPDSEVITYVYDEGGNLKSFAGDKQGTQVTYLDTLHYDKFEQRSYLKLGNGIETNYTYDPASRRLDNLMSEGSRAGKFQNLKYGYDAVGNILTLNNRVDVPAPSAFGGPNKQTFKYDDLYRLVHAEGEYKFAPDKQRNYTLDLSYDTNHNILKKTQTDAITVAGGSAIPQKGTSYDWSYQYKSSHPHAPTHIGNRSFEYDLNGNQANWQSDLNGTRRYIQWDEENRIAEIDDNGHRNKYVYDAAGERVIKTTQQGETVYVNQYYVVRNRSVVSKHLFAGSSRIVSHLVMGTAPGNEDRGAPGNGHAYGSDNTSVGNGNGPVDKGNNGQNGKDKEHSNNGLHLGQLKNGTMDKENPGQGRERRSDTANAHAQDINKNPTLTGEHPGQGTANRSARANSVAQNTNRNPNLVIREGEASVELGGDISGGETTGDSTSSYVVNGQSEFIWYYHPDHLGSTGFVTDANGELYEHVEYFPFGETWVQEHSNTQRTPYLYTGKELDEETQLYYYGARYYDPRTSVWQSADPILGGYLNGKVNKGIYNSNNLTFYAYSYNNPVVLVDPDGEKVIAVFFHGGPNPIGKTGVPTEDANGAGRRFNDAKKMAGDAGQKFVGTIVKPGTNTHAYSTGEWGASNFIDENYEIGDVVLIYGYSWGGDSAVNLAQRQSGNGRNIHLITVDGTDGFFGNMTVDRDIPSEIESSNIYQTKPSGEGWLKRLGCNGCKDIDRPFPGSHGEPNSGQYNRDVTAPGVNHGNIQDKAKDIINSRIQNAIDESHD